jgi:hypothetical protein
MRDTDLLLSSNCQVPSGRTTDSISTNGVGARSIHFRGGRKVYMKVLKEKRAL